MLFSRFDGALSSEMLGITFTKNHDLRLAAGKDFFESFLPNFMRCLENLFCNSQGDYFVNNHVNTKKA